MVGASELANWIAGRVSGVGVSGLRSVWSGHLSVCWELEFGSLGPHRCVGTNK